MEEIELGGFYQQSYTVHSHKSQIGPCHPKFNPNHHKESSRTWKEPQHIITQQLITAPRQLQQSDGKYIFLVCEQAGSQHITEFSSHPSNEKTPDLWILTANFCLSLKSKKQKPAFNLQLFQIPRQIDKTADHKSSF